MHVVALKQYLEPIAAAIADDHLIRGASKYVTGRIRHAVVSIRQIPFQLIIKKQIRGGLLGKVSAERNSIKPALAEFENSRKALEMELPVSNVIGAARTTHGVYSLIQFVPECSTLLEKLNERPAPQVARFIESFHRKFVYHRDLNSSNILFSPSGILLADCAGLVFRDDASPKHELMGFAKLYRHIRKNAGKQTAENFMTELLLQYYGSDGSADSALKYCRRSVKFHLT